MKAHQWFVEHREDFVVGTLERQELSAFRDHLERCPECREAIGEIERDLRWLPLGAAPVTVPPGMVRQLANGVLDRPRRNPWTWLVPAALAASTVGAAWYGLDQRRRATVLGRELAEVRAGLLERDGRLAAVLDTLGSIRTANRVLQAQLAIAGRRATMVVFETDRTQQWTVIVNGLPPAPAGERYGLWFLCEKGMRQGAALAGTSGTAVLVVAKPTDLGAVLAASVTLESERMVDGMPMAKREIGLIKM